MLLFLLLLLQIGQQVVPKEVALLKHKYVINMLDHFEDHDNFYIVMETPEKYIDLFDYISGKRIMSKRSARFLFRQVRQCFVPSLCRVLLDIKYLHISVERVMSTMSQPAWFLLNKCYLSLTALAVTA